MPRPLPPRGGLPSELTGPRFEVVDLAEERDDLAAAVARPGPALALLYRFDEADEALRRVTLPLQDALDVTLDQSLKSLVEICPRERIFVALAGVVVGRDRAIREGRDLVAERVSQNKPREVGALDIDGTAGVVGLDANGSYILHPHRDLAARLRVQQRQRRRQI